jgi:hypothetical protein
MPSSPRMTSKMDFKEEALEHVVKGRERIYGSYRKFLVKYQRFPWIKQFQSCAIYLSL